MAIIKPNNNTISAITALPAAISTGKVLQVVTFNSDTKESTTNTSFTGSLKRLSITPSATSSKILILASASVSGSHSGETQGIVLLRGGSVITGASGDADGSRGLASSMAYLINSGGSVQTISMQYLDSPASTSQQTYSIQLKYFAGGTHTMYINRLQSDDNAQYRTRSASFVTAMEVSA